jgi:uncharacterized protein involved in exopolysaccharide biosynthesis
MLPAQQTFSISRRTLDVEDYVDIARRHAGWIAGPAFFGIVASICIAFMLPNEYTSKATMQITPAAISDSMVQSTINTQLNERVMQMQQTILSRTELSLIIQDPKLNLYREELKTKPLEDVIDAMRKDVSINIVALPGALSKRASAFEISFNYYDRYKAMQTVQTLMTKFDDLNQSTQKMQQDQVKGFVGDELTKAKADLQQANDALTAFKQANAGKLPEGAQQNIARDQALSTKIQSDNEMIFRVNEQINNLALQRQMTKARIDSLNEQEQEILSAPSPGSAVAKQNDELTGIEKSIENAEFNLQGLEKMYSPKHPEVVNTQKQLDNLKAKRDQLKEKQRLQQEADAAKPKEQTKRPTNPLIVEQRQRYNEDLARIDANEQQNKDELARLSDEVSKYRKESDQLNQMMKDSTGLEAPYEELHRAQQLADTTYQDLLKKQQLAEANGQLIQRKAGENLETLDVPSLPVAPTKPNRYAIIGAGFALSMILGVGMAGLQEAKDTSLKNLKDVRAYTNLPVLCSIPLLENTMLVKRKRRLTYLAWSAAVLVGAAAVSGAVIYYETFTNSVKS